MEPLPSRSAGDSEGITDGLPGIPTLSGCPDSIGYQPRQVYAGLPKIIETGQGIDAERNAPGAHRWQSQSQGKVRVSSSMSTAMTPEQNECCGTSGSQYPDRYVGSSSSLLTSTPRQV